MKDFCGFLKDFCGFLRIFWILMDFNGFWGFYGFFWIFSGFFHEVYGIFGVKCPSVPTSLVQPWYNKNVTRLTTQCCNNIFISWLYQTCWSNLATSLIISTRLLPIVNSLLHTCWQLGSSSANTTCWRLVGRLVVVTSCEIFARVLFSSFHALTSFVIYYSTHARQNEIYLLNRQSKIIT